MPRSGNILLNKRRNKRINKRSDYAVFKRSSRFIGRKVVCTITVKNRTAENRGDVLRPLPVNRHERAIGM